jgi:putative Mg2+ transporter-C (MgtC) family protein
MVRGLTTAATLWLVTVIGLCFGGGQTLLGIAATIVTLATLWLMKYMEAMTVPGRRGRISMTFSPEASEETAIFALLAEREFEMRSHRVERSQNVINLTCSGRYQGRYLTGRQMRPYVATTTTVDRLWDLAHVPYMFYGSTRP